MTIEAETIDDLVDQCALSVRDLNSRLTKLERQVDSGELQERIDFLANRASALITRDAVCTEVSRARPDLAVRLCAMRDEPDEFWRERDDWSIDEWIFFLESD